MSLYSGWRKRYRAIFLLLCAAGAIGWVTYQSVYQAPLDRELIKAMISDDYNSPKPEMARRLLQRGANPNAPGPNEDSPILLIDYSARHGRALTPYRAVGWLFGRRDETALIIAVTQGDYGGAEDMAANLAELLASHGGDVNARGAEGKTALMQACMRCYDEAAKVLIAHHADVNLRTDEGETALMLAASHHGDVQTLRLLLAAGAQVNLRDSDGRTALYYAEEEIKHEEPKNYDRIQLLKRAGGVR